MSIGKKIKVFRKKNNLTEKEFAEKIGVTEDKIKFWEKELNRPSNQILAKICGLFNLKIDYFFDDNSDEIKPDKISNFKKKIEKKRNEISNTINKNNRNSGLNNNFIIEQFEKLNKRIDELFEIVKNQPNINDIKEIDYTYSMDTVNKKLKQGWILIELFKDEKGILGYRLGKK